MSLLKNKVEDGRLLRPDPRLVEILKPENFHVDRKHEVSKDGALIFGPCYCCRHYKHIDLDPVEMGACAEMGSEHFLVQAGDTGCTVFQPTEEAEQYAKQQGR